MREVCTVLLDKELLFKNPTTLATKRSVWPSSSYVKRCRSRISFVAVGCLDGQGFGSKFDRVCITARTR